jgi:hypothetical protein
VTSATTNRHVKSQRIPSSRGSHPTGVDSRAVIRTEVEVDPFLASRNEPAVVHAKFGTRVDQNLSFTNSVGEEKAACDCRSDMCRY